MIVVKLISGLGNQLFQYSFARRISLERNVPLKLDISFYDSQDLRAYKLDCFNIEAEVITRQEVNRFLRKDWLWPARKGWNATQRLFPYYKKRFVEEQEKFEYDPAMNKMGKNAYIVGYWQHHQYHQRHESTLRKELTLRPSYQQKVGQLRDEIEANGQSVSLHIRRGDYVTDPYAKGRFGALPMSYYRKAIEQIKQRTVKPEIYVFSDEIDWAKEHLNVECPTHYVSLDDPDQDVLELFLMSRCKHNIMANSTFSWWGAYLNSNPEKIVIAPQRWSNDPHVNSKINIQPPQWKLM